MASRRRMRKCGGKLLLVGITLLLLYIRFNCKKENTIFNRITTDLSQSTNHLYSQFLQYPFIYDETSSSTTEKCSIVILLWTNFYDKPFLPEKEFHRQFMKDCPTCMINCSVKVTSNRSLLHVSDGVVFYGENLSKYDLPKTHSMNQVWIFYQLESPAYTTPMLLLYSGIFNWTMTYRMDSDIWSPYGRISPLKKDGSAIIDAVTVTRETMKQRTKLVAWVVSHCHTHSKREEYVKELMKYISVDVFGKCGDHICSSNITACMEDISKQYKFYLSLENSRCANYVTEKYFNALKHSLIPIVNGGVNRDEYERIGPPKAFINIRNFSSPKRLAEYLHYLNRNEDEYLSYFKWKSKFKVGGGGTTDEGWCKLCHKLKEQKKHTSHKYYEDLSKWWNYIDDSKPACHSSSKLSK